jgi:hypothetical protein
VSIDSNSHLSHNFLLGPLLIINTTRSAQLAGWPGTIISDTFSIRQYCGTVDFTKSLAVNGATIVGGANVAEAVNGPVVGGGVGVNPTVLNGVSPEIASLPNLVSSVVSNIYLQQLHSDSFDADSRLAHRATSDHRPDAHDR